MAILEYLIFMAIMWAYGHQILGLFSIDSIGGILLNIAALLNLISLVICIFSAKKFEKSISLEKISFF